MDALDAKEHLEIFFDLNLKDDRLMHIDEHVPTELCLRNAKDFDGGKGSFLGVGGGGGRGAAGWSMEGPGSA